jgi:cell division transport system permease protein
MTDRIPEQAHEREQAHEHPAAQVVLHEDALPNFEAPIVPKATIGGRALTAVVAIMTFLASITTGSVMLIYAASSDWQSEVAREITIQVRAAAGRDIEADIAKAAAVARATPGIADVRPYTKEESARLLEPWLGSGLALDDLPVPRLIVVRLASGDKPDFAVLRRALAEAVPPASLDDHRDFVERMRSMAQAAVVAGAAVLALVLLATVLSVTFATRGAMATNRPVIEVLHFIGAKDNFIAGHFQRHFLVVGLKGGLLGGGCGILLFLLLEIAGQWIGGTVAGDQLSGLFGTFSIGWLGYLLVLLQIVLVAGVAAAASRATVNRTLQTIN